MKTPASGGFGSIADRVVADHRVKVGFQKKFLACGETIGTLHSEVATDWH